MSQSGSAYRQWVASPWADLAMAAGLTLLGQLELHSAAQGGLDGLGQGIALLAQTAPVAIRRTYTLAAACVGAIALIAEALIVEPTNTLAGLLVASSSSTASGSICPAGCCAPRPFVVARGLGLHIAPAMPSSGPADFAFAGLFSAVAWGLGQGGRRRVEAAGLLSVWPC